MSLNTNPDSPRQKMINLMYIVLMALKRAVQSN